MKFRVPRRVCQATVLIPLLVHAVGKRRCRLIALWPEISLVLGHSTDDNVALFIIGLVLGRFWRLASCTLLFRS
jgi:hypothetical protein